MAHAAAERSPQAITILILVVISSSKFLPGAPLACAQSESTLGLAQSLKTLREGEVHIESTLAISSTLGTSLSIEQVRPKTPPEVSQIVYRGTGSRAFLSHKSESGTSDSPFRIQSDYVLDDEGELLTIQAPLTADLLQDASDDSISVVLQSPRLAPSTPPNDRRTLMAMINDRGLPLGYLDGRDLADYFAGGETTSTEPVRGTSLIRLSSQSENGDLNILLDPQYGYLPRELHLVKRRDHLSGTRRVSEIDMAGDGARWPAGKVVELLWTATGIELDRKGNTPYIRRVTLHADTVSAAGPVVRLTTQSDVTAFDPDASFTEDQLKSALKAPEHYRVTIEGAPHLPYEWDGAKVIPRITGAAALTVAERPGGLRNWILGLNAMLVVYLAYRVRRRRRSPDFPTY